jgi:hypothetical protein
VRRKEKYNIYDGHCFLVAKANSAAEGEATKGERDYGWVIGFAIALWVVFLLTVPLAYLLFWWRPLYYEGFTTERSIRRAFDFFVAPAIALALLLALTSGRNRRDKKRPEGAGSGASLTYERRGLKRSYKMEDRA